MASSSTSTSSSTKPSPSDSSSTPTANSTRLFISNLSPSIDEFTLIQLFQKYGTISKLDFLFQKSGPNKGQPRGYAFLEFSKKEEAMMALVETGGKMWRGRKLEVGWARESQYQPSSSTSSSSGAHRRRDDHFKPTTLSLLKNSKKPEGGVDGKIRAMERKLEEMRRKKGGGEIKK